MGYVEEETYKPKNQLIGSIKNGKVNYPTDQKFFHSSDVPPQVKSVVGQVRDDIDPDILGARKKKWNSSVFVEKKEKDHEAELFKVRKGFLDESITDPRDQLVYQGTEV